MLSVVIPIYNEEELLASAVRALHARLGTLGRPFEILLADNGSCDSTYAIANELGRELRGVRVLRTPAPNYGRALRGGIEGAAGDVVACDEIDLGDIGFYARALPLIEAGAHLVVGSKRHRESVDDRPWVRRAGTALMTSLLRLTLGFRGTDSHGLKMLQREPLLPIVRACRVDHDLFASELVIRTARAGLDVRELPLALHEIRPPSVHLWRRVPRVLRDIVRLVYHIRVRG